jgi:hypothetical protein
MAHNSRLKAGLMAAGFAALLVGFGAYLLITRASDPSGVEAARAACLERGASDTSLVYSNVSTRGLSQYALVVFWSDRKSQRFRVALQRSFAKRSWRVAEVWESPPMSSALGKKSPAGRKLTDLKLSAALTQDDVKALWGPEDFDAGSGLYIPSYDIEGGSIIMFWFDMDPAHRPRLEAARVVSPGGEEKWLFGR